MYRMDPTSFFGHKCDLRSFGRQQRAENTLKAARILTPYVQPPQIGCQRFNRLRKGSHSDPSINTSCVPSITYTLTYREVVLGSP